MYVFIYRAGSKIGLRNRGWGVNSVSHALRRHGTPFRKFRDLFFKKSKYIGTPFRKFWDLLFKKSKNRLSRPIYFFIFCRYMIPWEKFLGYKILILEIGMIPWGKFLGLNF